MLLHQNTGSIAGETRESLRSSSTPRQGRRQLFLQSTPVNPLQTNGLQFSPLLEMSALCNSSKSIDVDITGDDTMPNTSCAVQHQTVTEKLKTCNPPFSSLEGSPFAEPEKSDTECSSASEESEPHFSSENESFSIDDDTSDSDALSCSSSGSGGIRSDDKEEIVVESVDIDYPEYLTESDSATLTALDLNLTGSSQHSLPTGDNFTAEANASQHTLPEDTQGVEANSGFSPTSPVCGPLTIEQNQEKLKADLIAGFNGLQSPDDSLLRFVNYFKADRVIVEVNQIVSLFSGQCPEIACNGIRKVTEQKIDGGVLLITHQCSKGHGGVWSSSAVLTEKRGQKLYVSSVLLASSVLVSGNNFEKVSLLAKGMNLNYVSSSFFSRMQNWYALPSITHLWSKMKEVVWKVFQNDILVICGDGRMDSPGFSAKYCVYTMMEHHLNIIVDIEVVDKREAGGTSTLMEKMGCKRLLERLMTNLNLGEFVSDASRVILKMVRELKEANCEVLANLFHSLDIWHKSIKLTAKITAASKIKGCEKLHQWVEPIRNHFWHCAETCEGDVDRLKDLWLGIVHHVCGEHEWNEGQCSHDPLTEIEGGKEYLEMDSKAAKELKKIVLDREWLKSLEFYVFFRHTSSLENFNSMLLKYAPKRIAFA